MDDGMDRLLARLADEPPKRDLSSLERDVWRRVGERHEAFYLPVAWRSGLAAASLAAGVAFGSFGPIPSSGSTPNSDPLAVFSTSARLAPSTLIEGGS